MCNNKKKCNCKDYSNVPKIYSSGVVYEGFIPETSPLSEDNCGVTVEEILEDIYNNLDVIGGVYTAGEAMLLEGTEFSVNLGTESGQALPGTWRPTWEDIVDAPDIPQETNIIAGQGIEVTGNFPDFTITNTADGQDSLSGISINGVEVTPSANNVSNIPVASTSTLGVVRAGSGVNIDSNGIISSEGANYTAGQGLTLSGEEFSIGYAVEGTGTYVRSVTRNSNGLLITLGTPPDTYTTYSAGNGITLSGTSFSLPVTVSGTGSYVQSVTQTSGGITVTLGTPPNTTYTAGTGLSLTGTTFNNTSPNATHTGDVTGATALTISNDVVSNTKLSNMPARTLKGNSATSTGDPTDLSVTAVKSMLNVGSAIQILTTFPSTVNIGSESQKAVFVKLADTTGTTTITVQNGNFDGQQLFIEYNRYLPTDTANSVTLAGQFINYNPEEEETVVSTLINSNRRRTFAYWSVTNGAWMTRIPKVAE